MATLLGWVVGPLVFAAYPDCNFLVDYCVYQIDGMKFGNAWFDMARPDSKHGDICNATSWQMYDDCLQDCPLEFVITEPKWYSMKLCLQDTYFKPFRPSAHLDLEHPLNGVEMEVVAPGTGSEDVNPSRYACDMTDFNDKNYTGKIVIAKQGNCGFAQKIGNIGHAGGLVGLLARTSNRNYVASQMTGMEGSSVEAYIVSFGVVQAGTDFILDYLDKGGKVKGKVQLTCKDRTLPDESMWDGCSYAGDVISQYGGCGEMPDERDRLCVKCPVEATVGGKTLCLRGNTILPRKALNQMWTSPEFSLPFEATNMAYLENTPGYGCLESDFTPYAGKVVFVPMPYNCMYHKSVLLAQSAGVKAYVLITPKEWKFAYSITGTSSIVNISVHSLDPKSYTDFVNLATTMPPSSNGGYMFDISAKYAEGSYPPYTAPVTQVPEVVVVEKVELVKKQFEFTGVVIGMLIFSIVVLVLIILKMIFRQKVVVGDDSGRNIPLGFASALLSLTLLSVVTTVSFTLAYTNGQDSTTTAIDDGNSAVNNSFANSEEVVSELNDRWRNAILDSAYVATTEFFVEGFTLGYTIRDIMTSYDGTWASFTKLFPSFYGFTAHTDWLIMLRTNEGFHISDYSVTDSRPDAVRGDGLPNVAVTNDGYPYDYVWYWLNTLIMQPTFYSTFAKTTIDVFDTIGEYFGRWQDYLGGYSRGDQATVWVFSTYSFVGLTSYQGTGGQMAEWELTHPVTLLLPVFNATPKLVGSVQVSKSVEYLNGRVSGLVNSFKDAENVTVFIIRDDGVILTSTYGTTRRIDQYTRMYGMVYAAKESFSLDNTYGKELNALGHYLKHINNGKLIASGSTKGEFEQQTWYKDESGWAVFTFTFETGSTTDLTGNNYKAEVREGDLCNGKVDCIVVDSDPERNHVLQFDGKTVFYIYMNLTVDTPRVKGTQVSKPGEPWRSSFKLYNNTQVDPDGSELIIYYDDGTNLWNPVLREPFVVQVATVSLWVKPDEPISDAKVPAKLAPRLFADTEQGDARWLWYASGMFFLGIENYGCTTDVISGGPPVGVWTHLSASIDQLVEKVCRVYINGTLHSEVPVSQFTSVPWPEFEPYRIGQHFKGRIDDVQVFNNSLNDAEAWTLYKTGKYVKDVPVKNWVYNIRSFQTNGTVGMNFSVGILIPKDDVLRTVREGNALTKSKLQIQQSNTKTKLDQKMGESLFIVVPIVLLCALGFLVFNDRLTAPFSEMAWMMNEASLMRLTEVKLRSSVITEMNVMYKAMHQMVWNLNAFRSFMPASVLIQAQGESDDDERATELSGTEDISSGKVSSSSKNVKISNRDVIDRIALSATRRKAACLMVNIVGWHPYIKEMEGPQLVELYNKLVNNVIDIIHAYRGVCENFSGDRFFGGFNTVRPISGFKMSACEAALELKYNWKLPVPPSIAVVYGDGIAGNLGSQVMKKHMFLSVIVPWGYALERFAKVKNLGVVTDDFLAETITDCIYSRAVGIADYPKRIPRLIGIYQLVQKMEVANSEWMYQLDSITKHDYWNEFSKALFSKDYAKAREIRTHLENIPKDVRVVYEDLCAMLDEQNFEPTKLEFC
eukprot:TRINITY_DN8533_c0_g1_i1.p1 TRINITY_DN8533_c0_g1~~TRINITY_DN8533_c0_g1_i1.p1  ORF type:complete len:1582 (+),score=353.60 TRINITY_DN8533_c0_g1_i1:42-4787(+)